MICIAECVLRQLPATRLDGPMSPSARYHCSCQNDVPLEAVLSAGSHLNQLYYGAFLDELPAAPLSCIQHLLGPAFRSGNHVPSPTARSELSAQSHSGFLACSSTPNM